MASRSRRTAPAALAALVLGVALGATRARAQQTQRQLWNEIDGYWTSPSKAYRLFGFASLTRAEESNTLEGSLSMNLDYLPLSWGFLRTGYRETFSLTETKYAEQRILLEATIPATTGVLRFRNRTELELRWINGAPSQRYRDRVRLEREVGVPWLRRFVPYATYELYYDTRYRALSRTGYRFGSVLTFNPRVGFDLSAAWQDNRFGTPRHVGAIDSKVALSY